MALLESQNIPPSLDAGFSRLLYSSQTPTLGTFRESLSPAARAAQQHRQASPFLDLITSAAHWLTDQWSPANKGAFYLARRNELLASTFDPSFWTAAAVTDDRTEYGVPEVSPYVHPIPPAYNDPLRQPSNSKYGFWSRTYPTPPQWGTADQPAPGWEGQVFDLLYRDMWFTQRRLTFGLPFTTTADDDRPIVIALGGEIHAWASTRGNRAWFVLATHPLFWSSSADTGNPENHLAINWSSDHQLPIALPPENPAGWYHRRPIATLRDGRRQAARSKAPDYNRLWVILAAPPSRGVYSARNDFVRVHVISDVAVYMARRSDD